MANNNADKRVKISRPAKSKNIEATKYYIFNETGNIMIASTVDTSQPISDLAQDIFNEVSVFFAAMTRAISTTVNTNDTTNYQDGNNGKNYYSLYNYGALSRVIGGSGLFVRLQEEDVSYVTDTYGMDFSKQLIESLLGLATGEGELAFASAMIASMGSEGLKMSKYSSNVDARVGNIVFVCEYLLGMPTVSAIVVYADSKEHKDHIEAGPCWSYDSVHTEWKLHKDTYLFVTPKFIRQYAGDLESIEADPTYFQLVNWLQDLVEEKMRILFIADDTGNVITNGILTIGKTYKISGEFFPQDQGSLNFANTPKTPITVSGWTTSEIQFSIAKAVATADGIQILEKGTNKLLLTTAPVTVA